MSFVSYTVSQQNAVMLTQVSIHDTKPSLAEASFSKKERPSAFAALQRDKADVIVYRGSLPAQG